jgi:hypothetical protein
MWLVCGSGPLALFYGELYLYLRDTVIKYLGYYYYYYCYYIIIIIIIVIAITMRLNTLGRKTHDAVLLY